MAFKLLQPIVKFIQSLGADDIFISYTRLDAGLYAEGLADELTKLGYSCFIDKRGTDPNKDLPDTLRRKIRGCSMLVVVGTERAAGRETVEQEIREFLSTGRTSIVPVNFKDAVYGARWYPLVEGIAPEPEPRPNALEDGSPSASVVGRVKKQFTYRRRDERLRRVTRRAIAVLALLVIAIAVAAGVAFQQIARATAETAKATKAAGDAQAAEARAREAQAGAQRAQEAADASRAEANRQRDEATKQKAVADEATQTAAEKTRLANEAARKAQEATARAAAEQARAERETARAERQAAIAGIRAGANRSQTYLRQRPEDVSGSLSYATDALRKAERIAFRSADADAAMRESLALLPLRRGSVRLPALSTARTALSPGGLNYALLDSGVLRVYAFAGGGGGVGAKPLLERPCECSAVALDGGAAHAAAVLFKGGFKIFDLKDDSRSRLFDSFKGGSGEQVNSADGLALSPDGRYLALNVWEGEGMDMHSALLIYDAASGEPVKIYDDDTAEGDSAKDTAFGPTGRLNMFIHDVAFGPTGDLAVGGEFKGVSAGGVVIWNLHEDIPQRLNADSFRHYRIIPQGGEVKAVAPGADNTYFATDRGVWRSLTGQNRFEPAARIPFPADYVGSPSDVSMAFRPDGRSIALVRRLAPSTNRGERDMSFEVWDASGHTEQAEAFQSAEVTRLGFEPGGRLFATLTHEPSEDLKEEPSGERRSRRLRVYNAETGAEAEAAEPIEGDPLYESDPLYVSPDAAYYVTMPGNSAQVWDVWAKDVAKRTSSARFDDVLDGVKAAAVSRGGRFLALEGLRDDAERIVIYRRDGGAYTEVKRFALGGAFLRNEFGVMAISADGRRLAVHANSTASVRVFDDGVENAALGKSLGDTEAAQMIALSADGRHLAVWEKGRTRLLDTTGGSWETLLDDERNEVTCMAFSPDGAYVGVGSDDGLLHVFETARPEGAGGVAKEDARVTKEEMARLQRAGKVTAVAFSDDGRYVATASNNRYSYGFVEGESYPVRVWLLRPSELIKEAEKRLARGTPSTR